MTNNKKGHIIYSKEIKETGQVDEEATWSKHRVIIDADTHEISRIKLKATEFEQRFGYAMLKGIENGETV